MPDAQGRIRPVSIPRVPWHDKEPEPECSHEPAPVPLSASEILSGGVIIDTAALPPAGGSGYTQCVHCGVPMHAQRDTRRRLTIWGWREMMGFDPYGDEMPVPDE